MKIFREIVRNTEMGIQSISNLMPYVEEEDFKKLILSQQETLRGFYDKAICQLTCDEQEQAKSGIIEKTMLKAGVNMNAVFNNTSSHMASMQPWRSHRSWHTPRGPYRHTYRTYMHDRFRHR